MPGLPKRQGASGHRSGQAEDWARPGLSLGNPKELNIFAALILGFALIVLVGFLLLLLPQASAVGQVTHPITALFTAASAVSDTGLTVVETGTYWSPFGQVVILALLQLGGLGFMFITSFLLFLAARRVLFRDFRVSDALGAANVGDFARLALWTLSITAVAEGLGTFLLWLRLRQELQPNDAWWQSIFHSISAFNNAGFDIVGKGNSFAPYAGDAHILSVMAGLAFLGSLSIPVIIGLLTRVTWGRLSLDTKLALASTLFLLASGTVALFLMEYNNLGSLGSMDTQGKLVNSFFTSVTARTTGFSSLNMGALSLQALFIIMLLMFIGGVSGSTAGGIKVNTFSVLVLTALSYIRGRRHVNAFGRQIPEVQIHKAVAVIFFAILTVFAVSLTLSALEEGLPFSSIFFETVSAFGTVGFSTGITASLSTVGQLLLVLTMFVGRLGPITVALALAERGAVREEVLPEEDVRVG